MSKDYRKRTTSRTKSRRNNGSFGRVIFGIVIGLVIAIAFYWQHNVPTPHSDVTHAAARPAAATTAAATTPPRPANTPKKAVAATPEFDFYTVLPNMQVTPSNGTKPVATAKPPTMPTAPGNPAATTTTPPADAIAPEAATPATTTTPNAPATTEPVASLVTIPDTAAPAAATPTPAPAPTPRAAPNKTEQLSGYMIQMASLKNYAEADRLKAQLAMQGFDVYIQTTTLNSGQTVNRVVMGPYGSRQVALQQQAQLQKNNIASILVKAP